MTEGKARWVYLRRWRALFLFVFLSGIPCIALVNENSRPRFHSNVPFVVSGLTWLMLIHFTSLRLSKFRCPRCGEYFAHPDDRITNTWTLAAKCSHCGLRKYSDW